MIDAAGYDTDKSRSYLRNYEKYFSRFTGNVNLLELGIFHGGSLLLWRDYFPGGVIAGLDINEVKVPDETGRIRVYRGKQQDTALLERIAAECGPFDIIIDDASHVGEPTKVSFWKLFGHLKEGGIYVIEDWRVGYWEGWPDGGRYGAKHSLFQGSRRFGSHDYGLVGFIKELVDELGADAYTHPSRGSKEPQRMPKFRSIEFFPGQVFVTKATAEDDALVRAAWSPSKL